LEDYFDVLSVILPEIQPMKNFDQHNPYHKYDVWLHTVRVVEGVPPEKVIRLAAFFHDIGKPVSFALDDEGIGHFYGHDAEGARMVSEILLRMKSDTRTRTGVEELVRIHCVPISPDEKTVKRRLNQYGEETIRRLIELKVADAKAQSERSADRIAPLLETLEAVRKCVTENECFSRKSLAIDGADLIQLGVIEGREIGTLLEEILQIVIRGELVNDRKILIDYVATRRRDQR
jgi:tRNA nucleotidyltransferase (CCA-adding enzyme)